MTERQQIRIGIALIIIQIMLLGITRAACWQLDRHAEKDGIDIMSMAAGK